MKKIACCLIVFMLVLSNVCCLAADTISFDPQTANKYSRSCLDWYEDDNNCAYLAYALLQDSGNLEKFIDFGSPERIVISYSDDGYITLITDMGTEACTFLYTPALGAACYYYSAEGEMSNGLYLLMALYLADLGDAKYVSVDAWNNGITDNFASAQQLPEYNDTDFLEIINCTNYDDIYNLLGEPETILESNGTYCYNVMVNAIEFSIHIDYDDNNRIEDMTLHSKDDFIDNIEDMPKEIIDFLNNILGESEVWHSPVNTTTYTWYTDEYEIEMIDYSGNMIIALGSSISISRYPK